MKRQLFRNIALAGAALLTLPLGSCVMEDDLPGCIQDEVYIRIRIETDDQGNRDNRFTRGLGEWEESEASVAERLMLPEDTRVYLFDGNNELITTAWPVSMPWLPSDGYYSLTVGVREEVLEMLERDADGNVVFKAAVAGGMKAIGSDYPQVAIGMPYNPGLDPLYAMRSDYYPDLSHGIPMYGVQELKVPEAPLLNSTMGAPADANTDLHILRSLCKIEVGDRMENKYTASDGNRYPRIDRVEATGYNTTGYLRFDPRHDGDYFADHTIMSARIPTGVSATSAAKVFFYESSVDRWRLYLPEGKLSGVELTMWVTRAPGETPAPFTYCLADAAFGTPDLIRNHIYRLDVTAVGATAELVAEVKDWNRVESELDFSQTVSMSRNLAWHITDGDDDFRVDEGAPGTPPVLHIYNGTTSWVRGDFEIASPVGATWTAQLVPGENGVNAFEFVTVDEYGNERGSSQVATGEVGQPATVYLRGVGEAPLTDSYAEIVIVVRHADNTALNAPIDAFQNTRYRLVRHRPLFQP